ncbi:hypothetical protein F5I97DRAFT_1330517 [Phlebopus sp. FC_14]|nr:hypothetical protein F5I97DRAFT_1330517 [Phlebopus sp. FC_14]
MGFFSSWRTDDARYLEDDRSVVQVIRSRFYGKYKGKERELFPSTASSRQLSRPGLKSQKSGGDPDSQHRRALSRSPRSPLRPLKQAAPPSVPRAHTDAITSTLAQRLNELAVANSEGLLNDDEYRLLRQNIFERLAGGSPVPTEAPVITLNSHSHSPYKSSQLNPDYVAAQYQAKPGRSPSVRSKSSVSSAMSNLFRRGSMRRVSAVSKDSTISETSSIFSVGSMASNPFKRAGIPRELRSDSPSMKQETQLEVRSSPSRQSGLEPSSLGSSSSYYLASRSTRRLGAPPSSFPGRNPEFKHSPSILTSSPSQDDGMKSSQDIHREIEVMEAEGRRLLDAFNGLELSALTRSQHKAGHAPSPRSPSTSVLTRRNREYNDSFLGASGSTSGRGTPYHGSDADGMSLRSGVSYGTNNSQPLSHRPNVSMKASGPLSPLSAAGRKRSISSLSSRARVPPSTSSPAVSQVRLRELGSVSSVNLAKPLSTRSAVSMDEDTEISALEAELGEIRRRRQEVTTRYRDRLEYLRAQLKGAELREKLLRK